MQPTPDPQIEELARARGEARRIRDWATADRLRGEIEAAGWKVVDLGSDYRLEPARPPDVEEDGRIRYGASASVPSRLEEPPTGTASVVLRATDRPEELSRALAGVRAHAGPGTHVVVVADNASPEQSARLESPSDDRHAEDGAGPGEHPDGDLAPIAGAAIEVVWTTVRLGLAAALNAGIRRARAEVVVVLDASVEPVGDLVTPLVAALQDETVAVVGPWGLSSTDMRRWEPAAAGDVDALDGRCLAFRRRDYVARGPLDEAFRGPEGLDAWWSLILRDEGGGRPPRVARSLADLPIHAHEDRRLEEIPEADRVRAVKRNRYRILDRFGQRLDLLDRDAAPSRA